MKNLMLTESFTKGKLTFKNRVFMAPMTRSRATQQIPTDLIADYYAQRASAGLIFTEATQVSPQGVGYIFTPGIHSQAQVDGWKKVTHKVHVQGGKVYLQLWHVGRVSHPDFHGGLLPVAPSAIGFSGQSYTLSGPKDVVTPRALELAEIKEIIEDFKKSAKLARDAGFDGVEIHGANGYLPAQFLEDGSNKRTDEYGGNLVNRARFLIELTQAVIDVWGAERVSVRISPNNPFNGMNDSNPKETYLYLVEQLEKLHLGMLHLVEPMQLPDGVPLASKIRKLFSGLLVLNAGYTLQTAEAAINEGRADAISFGSKFIANPDLPERFTKGFSLATPDPATFYGGAEKGYTDYSKMEY
ncbi:alkene reductase [Legionella bozemanae]|uniref:NADH-dependent flavin oxidoreductase, Oye family n=1 Tax=Legionella bozemanae TaxID=447 RepID=A0A0W0RET2_LEGBO|nr:alkene reductase [Legionella bozemanae]KTC69622.1 NADH-dependent flavin oxidoreductase, Oye family [Legionella bozemanae]STO33106.1 N-ethylmaleimide reductase [Legionella bozemanae]